MRFSKPFIVVLRSMSLLCLLFCGACSLPQQQVFDQFALSNGTELRPNAVVSSGGAVLPLRSWIPEDNRITPKAIIVALHGFNDYSYAFEQFGTYAAAQRIAVYAYDQRGFGASPETGIWPGKANLWRDLDIVVSLLNVKHEGVPLYILGHSMGGAVAITALAHENFPKERVKGMILAAPAVWGGDAMNGFYQMLLWAAAHTVPSLTLTGEGAEVQASDNIPMLMALGSDPLVIKKTRIDAVYGLVELMGQAQEDVDNISKPILFLYGAHDQVIPRSSIEKALHKLHAAYRLAIYPDGWHMLLRDLQSRAVWKDVISWVNNPSKVLPSGHQFQVTGDDS